MPNGRRVIVQKPLFHRQTDRQTDRQTAIVKPVYLENFVYGGIQTYFQYGNIVEKWPPGGQNFMGGVTFSRPVVQYLMLKFEPCQLLTLKNDPGSHFERWKMTPGVIFQRGHFLMLHLSIVEKARHTYFNLWWKKGGAGVHVLIDWKKMKYYRYEIRQLYKIPTSVLNATSLLFAAFNAEFEKIAL